MQDAWYRMKAKSYNDLEIYVLAKELAVKVHKMTLDKLPKFELYEEGSQIRRSSKGIVSNIVEGYGRRRHKNDFILFLTYAVASCDETKAHLEMLSQTGSLPQAIFQDLNKGYLELGAKPYNFRAAVEAKHRS
jgi:four helix bundle protein